MSRKRLYNYLLKISNLSDYSAFSSNNKTKPIWSKTGGVKILLNLSFVTPIILKSTDNVFYF